MSTSVMELSFEMPDDAFATFRRQKVDTLCPTSSSCHSADDRDIIDSSKLICSDDEVWLCECSSPSDTNLYKWLYSVEDEAPTDSKPSTKSIDTRTFTRPKKRFTRPSIEKYNEELYGTDLKELTDSGIQINGCSQDDSPTTKPLHFDLGQTASSVYFDNMIANAPMMDSFQNMSPPSLVNSMCSSTFANLMESSFIKNDPVLREIRDTDFTGSILQQEAEPMFQSITESYSSLNSDVPENFLKKVSFTEKSSGEVEGDVTVLRNATFEKEADMPCDQTMVIDDHHDENFQDAEATTYEDLNRTYQRKLKSTPAAPEAPLNGTFQRRKKNRFGTINRPDLNATVTLETDKKTSHDERTIENVKRLLDRRPSPSLDLNRLSYIVDKNDQLNSTFTNESPKRNSFGSTDSGENLDYMSLSSGSSKSSKPQSTDGLNMIVDIQEQNFRKPQFRKVPSHVVSTPKTRPRSPIVWINQEISPIRHGNSDPESSSNDQTVMQNSIRKQRSFGHIYQKTPSPKNATVSRLEMKGTIRSSQPNLKMSEPKPGLQRPSNLNSMGHTLKGSYTSLRPTNTNLPIAPPPLNSTITVAKVPAVAQVHPVPREIPPKSQDAQFVKPQPPRSGLPRPVTGIPRPFSRIPGPRSVRPVSKSAGHQGRL